MTEAARTLSYVETINPSKSDTLHRDIKKLYEEDLRHVFELLVKEVLSKLNVKKVELAVDGHKSLYWGKKAGLGVRGVQHERGTSQAWEWIVISMVKPFPLPLMALPYKQGKSLANITIELLEYAMNLPFKIKLCLFDRGFYNGHLIDFLEAKEVRYLILAPEYSVMKRYARDTDTIKGFTHQMSYTKKKSTWHPSTKIVVIKGLKDFNLYFATNLPTSIALASVYRRRWQIETNFRVIKEAKIKSKSNISIIRYFYFMIQLLLHLSWNLTKVKLINLPFKRYLTGIVKQILFLRQGIT